MMTRELRLGLSPARASHAVPREDITPTRTKARRADRELVAFKSADDDHGPLRIAALYTKVGDQICGVGYYKE
jgi:hypothetical protein